MSHADILDDRESLRKPMIGSVILHIGVFALVPLYAWYQAKYTAHFGSDAPIGGGSVGLDVSKTIPIPRPRGEINPLANDTESQVPRPDKPQPKQKVVEEEKDAVPLLKSKKQQKKLARQDDDVRPPERYHPQPVKPNQVTSSEGQRLITNMMAKPGSGGVGANMNSALGNQFGWYLDLVKQRIAQKWDTSEVDGRLQTAEPVIVDFDIQRDGSVSNLRIVQRSGVPTLEYSAQRAIQAAAPFPALPGGFNSSPMEIVFKLQR